MNYLRMPANHRLKLTAPSRSRFFCLAWLKSAPAWPAA